MNEESETGHLPRCDGNHHPLADDCNYRARVVFSERSCGGVSINGADPRFCEIHFLPWGHRDTTEDTA